MPLELAGKGRESLFFSGLMDDLVSELEGRFPESTRSWIHNGTALAIRNHGVRLLLVEGHGGLGCAFDPLDPEDIDAVRALLAQVKIAANPADMIEAVVRYPYKGRPYQLGEDYMLANTVEVYQLSPADRAVLQNILNGPYETCCRAVVYIAGAIGQDVADRVKGQLQHPAVYAEQFRPRNLGRLLSRLVGRRASNLVGFITYIAEHLTIEDNLRVHLSL